MSTLPDASPEVARTFYRSQLDGIEAEVRQLELIDGRFAHARLALFASLVIGLGFAVTSKHPLWIVWAAGSLVAFLVAVVWNEVYRDQLVDLRNQSRTLHRLMDRIDRNWSALSKDRLGKAAATIELTSRQAALAGDLDLTGESSLFQLVSMAGTHPGMRTLTSWLCDPADASLAQQRHAIANHLVQQREARIRFHTLARDVGASTGNPDEFVRWSKDDNWLTGRRWLVTWANLSAIIAVGLVGWLIVESIVARSGSGLWLALAGLIGLAVFNLILAAIFLAPAAQIFSIAMSSRRQVGELTELFGAAERLPDASEGSDRSSNLVTRWRAHLLDGPQSAMAGMTALSKVASAGGLKQAAATFFVYLPLQAWGLWDVRVLKRLEDWKDQYGSDVATWFDSLGELEAIHSIATFCDENPTWVSPTWIASDAATDEQAFAAVGLGHPLLPEGDRVRNDVSVGPRGTLLLVTGSNMSGKSTMLRSVGLNVSLASAGACVCAESLRLPALEVSTSIRVSDDLSQGVSYYMAELNRLAEVVQHAQAMAADREAGKTNRMMLFLLDEILQGTNSRERQIAVARVLRHLVQFGAIGAITTHDLELADDPDLVSMATTVHFRETITPDAHGNDRMTFDYKMRHGVSPTTNALRLLEMVGLHEDAVVQRQPVDQDDGDSGIQTSP